MQILAHGEALAVDYYSRDASVFLDTHYLIKGVAGALFWKLAREHERRQRNEFSLRELRLAGDELRLPEVQDNLSVRMLLLQRRLAERRAAAQIVKVGRGRFRLEVQRPLRLNEVAGRKMPSAPPAEPGPGWQSAPAPAGAGVPAASALDFTGWSWPVAAWASGRQPMVSWAMPPGPPVLLRSN